MSTVAGTTRGTVDAVRRAVAHTIWVVCSIAALFLALGALFIAFDANTGNALVKFVLDVADRLDLGVFDRNDGIKQWTSANAETKNALFNWGIGALVWLIAGRILDRLIRPSESAAKR
jgi:glucose dehydrogenase